jgi:DNA repair photolyase
VEITHTQVKNILTRTSGYLKTVTSHSLQPYRGCTLGRSLCGVGCYVRHNRWLTKGREWGSFLEVRDNAAEAYRAGYERERRWARRAQGRGEFSIFLSSSTEPFLPQERRFRITRQVLEAMLELPPDALILQSHSHGVADYLELYRELSRRCRLRVHVSIETDREGLPGLPPPGSPVERRFEAARTLKEAGVETVITVSPLLPIRDPEAFFRRCSECADAVVLDHFVGGDGSPDGRRTRATPLPQAIAAVEPEAESLAYRDRMVDIAHRHLPGRVGVSIDGFAGRYLNAPHRHRSAPPRPDAGE